MSPVPKVMNPFLKDERGSIGVLFIIALPIMLLVGAIAVDIGYLWSMQAQLQATADASALASASKIDNTGDAAIMATEYAEKNMPSEKYGEVVSADNIVLGKWDIDSGAFQAGETPPNAVKITAEMTDAGGNPVKLFFAQAIGVKDADVTASSIAFVEASGGFCILGLDPTLDKAVEFRGNANVDLKCGIASNSNAGDSVAVIGSATVAAPSVAMVGDINVQGAANMNSDLILPNSAAVADPYADLSLPSVDGCDYNDHTAKNTVTLYPGTYCGGLTVNAQAKVTMASGTYVIDNGNLKINGNAQVIGEGVTIILTSTTGSDYGTLTLNGGADISLSAPTDGDLKGILFFQDRHAPESGSNKINGGSEIEFKGLLYFPSQELQFTGGAEADNGCTHIIARKVTISGNADLENECDDSGLEPLGGKSLSIVG